MGDNERTDDVTVAGFRPSIQKEERWKNEKTNRVLIVFSLLLTGMRSYDKKNIHFHTFFVFDELFVGFCTGVIDLHH